MKKLMFKLETNNELVINEELNYYEKDNTFFIKHDDCIYKIMLDKEIFIKEDKEKIIDINIKSKLVTITLKENNLSFDMNLTTGNMKYTNKNIEIEYTLDDDENTYNCIFIEY